MRHPRFADPGDFRRARLHGLAVIILATLLLVGVCGQRADEPSVAAHRRVIVRLQGDTIPQAVLALGERVYLGREGGALCTTCHGPRAGGIPGLGPDLTDATWIHGDGSREFLREVIRTGVMRPKQSPAPMPPFGGGRLDAAKVDAVAAWVYMRGR